MSLAVKIGAGVIAGGVACGLVYAFWPRTPPELVNVRPAVEKPVLVIATETVKPVTATSPTQTAVGDDKAGIAKLAAALKSAPAAAAPIATPLAAPKPQGSANPETNDLAARFCAQGLVALAEGDIASARRWLERAAGAGDARALMVLGDTFDPATLARLGALGTPGDAARAREYYSRALAAGLGDAKERIAALEARRN